MARPLRLEYAGALYHVLARGNRREPIYLDATDFSEFLALLAEVCERFNESVTSFRAGTRHCWYRRMLICWRYHDTLF